QVVVNNRRGRDAYAVTDFADAGRIAAFIHVGFDVFQNILLSIRQLLRRHTLSPRSPAARWLFSALEQAFEVSLTTSPGPCQFVVKNCRHQVAKEPGLVQVHRVTRLRHDRHLRRGHELAHALGDLAVARVALTDDQMDRIADLGQSVPEWRLLARAHAAQAVDQTDRIVLEALRTLHASPIATDVGR